MGATLLGTGAPPPHPLRRGLATLLSLGDARFLVDAGTGAGVQLVKAGVRPYHWPPVFITHHHSDHTIDLGHLLVTGWIVGQNVPFEVFGPAGTRRQVDKLMDYLHWDIEVRREHMRDRRPPIVHVTEVEEGTVLEREGIRVSAFLVEHGPVKLAFRYRFEGGGRSVVVSGDNTQTPGRGRPRRRRRAREALAITHLMPGSVAAELTAATSAHYGGPVVVGEDLMDV